MARTSENDLLIIETVISRLMRRNTVRPFALTFFRFGEYFTRFNTKAIIILLENMENY